MTYKDGISTDVCAGDWQGKSGWGGGEKTSQIKVVVVTTNLIDQELELDDSSAALMLTVALHAGSAKA